MSYSSLTVGSSVATKINSIVGSCGETIGLPNFGSCVETSMFDIAIPISFSFFWIFSKVYEVDKYDVMVQMEW